MISNNSVIDGETVLKPAETPSDAGNPLNAQTAAVFEKRDIPALPSEYRVTGIGSKPHEDQLSFEQAAAIAVDLWSMVFKDKFKPEDTEVFVTNSGTGKGVNRSYEVCSDSRFIGGAAYICILDSITGQPICVQKQAPFDLCNTPPVSECLVNEGFDDFFVFRVIHRSRHHSCRLPGSALIHKVFWLE